MKMEYYAVIFLNILLVSWSAQEATINISEPSENKEQLASAVNEFGYNLMLKMMDDKPNKNIVISPTGVAGILAMTLLGSVGPPYDELAKVLGFSQDILENRKFHERFGSLLEELSNVNINSTSTVDNIDALENTSKSKSNGLENITSSECTNEETTTKTLYADAIIVEDNTRIRQMFRDYVERVYKGDAIKTSFENRLESQQLINDWVSNHTEGKIQSFLKEPLPVHTKAVLLNALFFSGQWAQPFIPSLTSNMSFYSPSGNVDAEFMLNSGLFKHASKAHGVNIIALPYNDSTTTMYVVKAFHRKSNLTNILMNLNFSIIDEIINSKMRLQECVVKFPKMDLMTKVNLKNPLKEMGVKSVFTPGDANFALMVEAGGNDDQLTRILEDRDTRRIADAVKSLPNPGVHIDSVLHHVHMTINEFGTVAVAASSGFLSRTARLFYADTPFFMFIRNEKTKLVTFSAIIFNPSASS